MKDNYSFHQIFVYLLVAYAITTLIVGNIIGIHWPSHNILSFSIIVAMFAGVGELYNMLSIKD
jgi:hypothetical protein